MLGKPATAAQMTRAGTAIGSRVVGAELYTAMNNEQKARVAVEYTRKHFISLVKVDDERAAAAAAGTNVDTEFEEAP